MRKMTRPNDTMAMVGMQRPRNPGDVRANTTRPIQNANRPMNQRQAMPAAQSYTRKRRLTTTEKIKRYVKRNAVYIFLATTALAIVIIASAATNMVRNELDENTIHDYGRERYYVEYVVQEGDTLWNISADMASTTPEYPSTKAYLKDLKETNHIYGDKIIEGHTIKLPQYRSSDTQRKIFGAYNIPET